jgi:hypothetical protein
MASWKSARARRHYLQNSPALVRVVSRAALAARSERERMAALTRLAGVSIPVASAILTLLDPRRYGVLDIRVWQLLHALDPAIGNRRGRGFTVAHWERYLATLRAEAQRRGVTARAMEWSLFHAHRALQRGRLYDPPLSARGGTAAGRPSAPDVRRREGRPRGRAARSRGGGGVRRPLGRQRHGGAEGSAGAGPPVPHGVLDGRVDARGGQRKRKAHEGARAPSCRTVPVGTTRRRSPGRSR